MTGALSPDGALALVASLTPRLRRAAVGQRDGACLAGDPDLFAAGAAALRAAGGTEVRTPKGLHVAADGRHLVVAEVDGEVLGGLLLVDLRAALAALPDA